MIVKTGYGYFLKDGKIVMKYDLPIGAHKDPEGLEVVEVNGAQELAGIEVDLSAAKEFHGMI